MTATIYRSEVVVLRTYPYRESDLVVEFFSAQAGLLRGFAHGGRNSVRRFGSALHLFSLIDLRWQQTRTDLVRLQDADLLRSRLPVSEHLPRFALAAYAVELLEQFLNPGEPQSHLFLHLNGFLDFLCDGGDPILARLLFELHLVQQLGLIPHLLHCSRCFGGFDSDQVVFDPEAGGSLCDRCSGRSGPLRISVGTLGSLSRLLQLSAGEYASVHLGQTTSTQGSAMLTLALTNIIRKPLQSLQFLAKVKAFAPLDIPESER